MVERQSDGGVAGDRLTGWKDIASYLGKAVRTAQRWEEELGLPVRRVKTGPGQAVYASRAELDGWLETADPSRLDAETHPEDADEAAAAPVSMSADAPPSAASLEPRRAAALTVDLTSAPEVRTESAPAVPIGGDRQGQGSAPPQWSWALVMSSGRTRYALATVGLLAAMAIGYGLGKPSAANFTGASLAFSGQRLEALAPGGRLLWAHDFGRPVGVFEREHWIKHQEGASLARVDLNADGTLEHVVPVRFAIGGQNPSDSDGLFAFGERGRMLWSVAPPGAISCGGQTYKGPWKLSAVTVAETPGPKRVWAAYKHHTWWPSIVVEIAPDGSQAIRYVQSGWVMSLTPWQRPDGLFLVAGGVLNEEVRPSVVVMRTDGPPTVSPTRTAAFACDIEGQAPVEMTTVGAFEVTRAKGFPYLMANRLHVLAGELRVELGHDAVATVGDTGRVESLATTDTYLRDHMALQPLVLTHALEDCAELHSQKPVGHWTPAEGWREYGVAVTTNLPRVVTATR